MFRRRSQDEQAQTSTAVMDGPRDPQAPKGRPTPKRSEAQSQRRKVVTASGDRKTAAKQAREARRAEMAKQREALASGDERYLPPRDKGPVRRFVRDYVDSRYRVAEFFLPLAVLILVMSVSPTLQSLSLLLWLVVIAAIVIDSAVSAFLLRKQLEKRFKGKNTRGAIAYGLMRTLQMRRLRLPKPQVTRGTKL